MICFNISVNGKVMAKAGVGDKGLLMIDLAWSNMHDQRDMNMMVHGRIPESDNKDLSDVPEQFKAMIPTGESLRWMTDYAPQIGDVINIEIIESKDYDEPQHRKTHPVGVKEHWKALKKTLDAFSKMSKIIEEEP